MGSSKRGLALVLRSQLHRPLRQEIRLCDVERGCDASGYIGDRLGIVLGQPIASATLG